MEKAFDQDSDKNDINDVEDGKLSKEGSEKEEPKTKELWARHLEFMLSCIGYAVGFGAFWRFPYLCMRNGGGKCRLTCLYVRLKIHIIIL